MLLPILLIEQRPLYPGTRRLHRPKLITGFCILSHLHPHPSSSTLARLVLGLPFSSYASWPTLCPKTRRRHLPSQSAKGRPSKLFLMPLRRGNMTVTTLLLAAKVHI